MVETISNKEAARIDAIAMKDLQERLSKILLEEFDQAYIQVLDLRHAKQHYTSLYTTLVNSKQLSHEWIKREETASDPRERVVPLFLREQKARILIRELYAQFLEKYYHEHIHQLEDVFVHEFKLQDAFEKDTQHVHNLIRDFLKGVEERTLSTIKRFLRREKDLFPKAKPLFRNKIVHDVEKQIKDMRKIIDKVRQV